MKILEAYQIGDYLGDDYEILRILGGAGKSGMGIVFVCYDHASKNIYALKTLQTRFFLSDELINAFRKEAFIWIKLEEHPYIVKALSFEFIEGLPFLKLEYIAPNNLDENTLNHYLKKDISINQIMIWGIQFCHAMEYAMNCGVSPHQDIKPDNLMITADKTLKITDFGLAKIFYNKKEVGKGNQITTGSTFDITSGVSIFKTSNGLSIAGTPVYMAPEQFAGMADLRSDIYSFGIVLFQAINKGKLPFEGTTLMDFIHKHTKENVPYIDSKLFPIVKKALEKNPNDRYQNFFELRKDFEDLYLYETEELPPSIPEKGELIEAEITRKGESFLYLGIYDEAIKEFNKVLEMNSKNDIAYYGLANAFRRKKDYSNAIRNYRSALIVNPNNYNAIAKLGDLLIEVGQHNDAINVLKDGASKFPEERIIRFNLGMAYILKNMINEAIAEYEAVIEVIIEHPIYYESIFILGMLYGKQNNLTSAIKHLKTFVALNPVHPLIKPARDLLQRFIVSLPHQTSKDDFPFFYEEQLFNDMTKFFVTLDISGLYKIIPKDLRILSSVICLATVSEKIGTQTNLFKWVSHVLITRIGLAFTDRNKSNNFILWNKIKINFENNGIRVNGINLYFGNQLGYTPNILKLLINGFSSFCKLIYLNFNSILKRAKDISKDNDLLLDYLLERSPPNVFNDLTLILHSGFIKLSLKILENIRLLKDVYFQKNLYHLLKKNYEILRDFDNALDVVQDLIDHDETDYFAADEKIRLTYLKNYHVIPDNIRKKATKLFNKGNRMKITFHKQVEYINKSLELDPYNINCWNRKLLMYKNLGDEKQIDICLEAIAKYKKPDIGVPQVIDIIDFNPEDLVCPNCGRVIQPSKFCKFCGKQLAYMDSYSQLLDSNLKKNEISEPETYKNTKSDMDPDSDIIIID